MSRTVSHGKQLRRIVYLDLHTDRCDECSLPYIYPRARRSQMEILVEQVDITKLSVQLHARSDVHGRSDAERRPEQSSGVRKICFRHLHAAGRDTNERERFHIVGESEHVNGFSPELEVDGAYRLQFRIQTRSSVVRRSLEGEQYRSLHAGECVARSVLARAESHPRHLAAAVQLRFPTLVLAPAPPASTPILKTPALNPGPDAGEVKVAV